MTTRVKHLTLVETRGYKAKPQAVRHISVPENVEIEPTLIKFADSLIREIESGEVVAVGFVALYKNNEIGHVISGNMTKGAGIFAFYGGVYELANMVKEHIQR